MIVAQVERHPAMTRDEAIALFRTLCQLPVQRLDELAEFWFDVVRIDPNCFNGVLMLHLVNVAVRLAETSGEAD